MDVSVMVLAYNHEDYIATALESVVTQELDATWEVIVAEDHSTDGTRDIVLEYAARYPDRIKPLLATTNRGAMVTYTRAFEAAKGEFVAYLDGDDYWRPGKLARQLRHLREHPEQTMCFHNVQVIREGQGAPTDLYHSEPLPSQQTLADLLRANSVPSCSLFYRRSALPELPAWFADMPYGDWAVVLSLAQRGPVGYIDEPLAVYRRHEGGLYTGSVERKRRSWDVAFLERIVAEIDPGYRDEALLRLAQARVEYARALADVGERGSAFSQLARSLREVPGHPELTRGRRLRGALRTLAPGSYDALHQRLRRRPHDANDLP